MAFDGEEPTHLEALPDLLLRARDLGFVWIELVTDGRRLAEPGYARQLATRGLGALRLRADGDLEEVEQTLDHCWEGGLRRVVLQGSSGLTAARTRELLRLARRRREVVRSVHLEPSGRGPAPSLDDLGAWVERGTDGAVGPLDWFDIAFFAPVSRLLAARSGGAAVELSAAPACGRVTAAMVDGRRVRSLAAMLDVPRLMQGLDQIARDQADERRIRAAARAAVQLLRVLAHPELAALAASATLRRGDPEFIERHVVSRFVTITSLCCLSTRHATAAQLSRCPFHVMRMDGRRVPRCTLDAGLQPRERSLQPNPRRL